MDLMARRFAMLAQIRAQPASVLYNWNLKSSLVDTISGVQATTNGSNTTDDNFGDGLILGLTVYDGNIYQ